MSRSRRNIFDKPSRHGLTLVELLVVLLILVIMTAVAVQSMSGIVDQTRYDATTRTLQNIQNATVGPVGQREPDGTPLVTGFVADVGRLPVATLDSTGNFLTLSELWSNPNGLAAFSLQQAAAPDTDVNLLCGWRGAYLQLPLGSSQLLDGWGNPLVNSLQNPALPQSLLFTDGATAVSAGQPIYWIRSYGSDAALGGSGYASDTDLVLANYVLGTTLPAGSTAINRFQATLLVNMSYLNQSGQAISSTNGTITTPNGTISNIVTTVTYFGPNPSTGTVLSVPGTLVSGATMTYQFPTQTIGPRLVRASCTYTYTPTGGSPTTLTVKSPITPVVLQPGGQSKTLFLQFPN